MPNSRGSDSEPSGPQLFQQSVSTATFRLSSRLRGTLSLSRLQLSEYEALKAGDFELDQLGVVSGLPAMLIKARIARGMSQRDLAERIGLKEQQIQRYEATDYASVSLSRIKDIVGGLSSGSARQSQD